MKQKVGGGGAAAAGGGGAGSPGAAARAGAPAGTKKSKKSKGRLFSLTVQPLPPAKFSAVVAAIHARKQAEAAALREQIVGNAKRAQEEAWRAAPTVLETGLDALEGFDAWGLRRPEREEGAATSSSSSAGAGASEPASGAGGDGGAEGEGEGRERKRQKTMADAVHLHRKLSDLQRTRTELRWLLEQVERLEYEAL